jgi:hypothetical protein
MLGCVLSALTAGAQPLDRRLQSAIDAADVDAALALAELRESPPEVRFTFVDLVASCNFDMKCSVALGPADGELKKMEAGMSEQGTEWPARVDGLVIISMVGQGAKGRMALPHGRVGGQPRILGGRYTAAKLGELKAKTTDALVDEMLTGGIRDEKGERRTDWKKAATTLPAGGGEAGKALVAHIAAMTAAVKAQDPDAAAAAAGPLGQRLYGAKRYDGAVIPLKTRQLRLRAQATRFLTEVRVLGGYQLGNQAVLAIDGVNANGWVERGAVLFSKEEGAWNSASTATVTYPR